MTWILKHKIAVAVAGIVVLLLWSSKAKAGVASAVYDTVTSGKQTGEYDLNILSPTFGKPL